MKLSEVQCRHAKAEKKPRKLYDMDGLYLLITSLKNNKTSKCWRFKYRIDGREKLLALGTFPEIGLRDARDLRNDARRLVAKGIDPNSTKRAEKVSKAGADSFKAVAYEWHAKYLHTWTKDHGESVLTRLEKNVFPWLGGMPIKEVKAPELLICLQRMEKRGALETAHRVKSSCSQIFRYAIATGRHDRDPAQDLKGALPPSKHRHFPTLTDPKKIGGLLRSIEGYEGSELVRAALRLAPMLFVRPGELRHAEWSEIDFEKAEWRIPACKMKMRVEHVVPLSKQAISILREVEPLTNNGAAAKYVFPSNRSLARPMSDNTLISALRRMGYDNTVIVPHGFRSMASTILNEQGWNRDAIERQLAHSEPNKVRGAYNHAEYLPQRRELMQAWADELDNFKQGAQIIQADFKKAG